MNLLIHNKRKRSRTALEIPVCVRHHSSLLCGATTVNVSAGGALIVFDHFLPAEIPVGLDFHFRSGSSFHNIQGEVLRSVPIHNRTKRVLAVKFDADYPELNDAAQREVERATDESKKKSK